MAIVRGQIRAAVIAGLTGLVTSGSRVFDSRLNPMDAQSMPGICVSIPSEKPGGEECLSSSERIADLFIDLYASGAAAEITLDTMESEIETKLWTMQGGGRWINSLVLGLSFIGMGTKYDGEGAKVYGIRRLMYSVSYLINDGDPEHAR